MSTYCALHVQTADKKSVFAELEKYLGLNHGRPVVVATATDALESLYGDEFICGEDRPTKFAIDDGTTGWIVAHYNSFDPLRELATDM
jgi:hypothetical protein